MSMRITSAQVVELRRVTLRSDGVASFSCTPLRMLVKTLPGAGLSVRAQAQRLVVESSTRLDRGSVMIGYARVSGVRPHTSACFRLLEKGCSRDIRTSAIDNLGGSEQGTLNNTWSQYSAACEVRIYLSEKFQAQASSG